MVLLFLRSQTHKQEGKQAHIISAMTREVALPLCIWIGTALLVIAPVTLRNYVKGNDLVLSAANAGITFYSSNNPRATGQYMDPPGWI